MAHDNSGWISQERFTAACAVLPLVSIDLLLITPQRQILLGLRTNHPAMGWWFTPGGRIRKNEPCEQALERLISTEIGALPAFLPRPELMGVWDHFFNESAFHPEETSHYVNLPHLLRIEIPVDISKLPVAQHSHWRWQDLSEAASSPDVHSYVRAYAQWILDHESDCASFVPAPNVRG